MCRELEAELKRGRELAEQLVDHMLRMNARSVELAVLRAKPDGDLVNFRVVAISDNSQ